MQSGTDPVLGNETTEESEGETSHYSARRKEILENAATVFADASEEYGSLPTLKKRLEAWKATQGGECSELFVQGLPVTGDKLLGAVCTRAAAALPTVVTAMHSGASS